VLNYIDTLECDNARKAAKAQKISASRNRDGRCLD